MKMKVEQVKRKRSVSHSPVSVKKSSSERDSGEESRGLGEESRCSVEKSSCRRDSGEQNTTLGKKCMYSVKRCKVEPVSVKKSSSERDSGEGSRVSSLQRDSGEKSGFLGEESTNSSFGRDSGEKNRIWGEESRRDFGEKSGILGEECRYSGKKSGTGAAFQSFERDCEEKFQSSTSVLTDESSSSTDGAADLSSASLVEIDKHSQDYADVADLFLRGLGVLLSDTCVSGIERIMYRDMYRVVEDFEKQQLRMVGMRGDCNVHWAWYGAGKQEIDSIVKYGFQMAVPSSVGYCFAPIECSRISAVQAKQDACGDQRLILCQVATGKVGVVSDSEHDESIDTGVYDLSNPKCYVIPASRFQPSRILAHHVVTFRLSNQWQEIIEASTLSGKPFPRPKMPSAETPQTVQLNQKKVSAIPPVFDDQVLTRCKIMSFPTLFNILQSKVPQLDLSELQQNYWNFKGGRLPRTDFIREVRRIVGDSLLYKSICVIKLWSQGCEKP